MKPEIRSVTFDRLEVRTDSDDGDSVQRVVGHAAVFDRDSEPIFGLFTERIRKGAFARAIAEKQDVRALINHDDSLVIGRSKAGTLELAEDEVGLAIDVPLPDTSFARDLAVSIERGDIDQMSFAFRAVKEEWESATDPGELDVRTLVDVDLFDVSVVTYPAYPDTDVQVRMRYADAIAAHERFTAGRRRRLEDDQRRQRQAAAEFALDIAEFGR